MQTAPSFQNHDRSEDRLKMFSLASEHALSVLLPDDEKYTRAPVDPYRMDAGYPKHTTGVVSPQWFRPQESRETRVCMFAGSAGVVAGRGVGISE